MTEPTRIPNPGYGPYLGVAQPRWCRMCEIHIATTHQPLCPSCLDDTARELRGES